MKANFFNIEKVSAISFITIFFI